MPADFRDAAGIVPADIGPQLALFEVTGMGTFVEIGLNNLRAEGFTHVTGAITNIKLEFVITRERFWRLVRTPQS
jgi:hypothetical protein